MKAISCSLIFVLLFAANCFAEQPARIEDRLVQFTVGPSGEPASGYLVLFLMSVNKHQWEMQQTDEKGVITSNGNTFLMLPHDPDRWSMMMATNSAAPSAEALFHVNGPGNWKTTKLLRKLGVKLKSKQDEIEGRHGIKADPAPQPGLIRMQTRSVDGKPLRNHPVHLIARKQSFSFSDRDTVIWKGKTDDNGVAQIRQFPGIKNWIVAFPEIGHTQTGPIVVDPGSVIDLELNRPVPYATISGQIDDKLLSAVNAESRVYLGTDHAWKYRESKIDSKGHFKITDVPVGSYSLKLTDLPTAYVRVSGLAYGEHREGVKINSPGEREAEIAEWNKQDRDRQLARKQWKPKLRGRVVDLNGKAMPGVTVYATLKFHGGIRMYQNTTEVITDADGFYEIEDAQFNYGSVALMAYVPGRPLAFAAGGYFGPVKESGVLVGVGGAVIGTEPADKMPEVLKQPDLVLPDPMRGGELKVSTLKDGKSFGKVDVQLELIDFNSSFSPGWAMAISETPETFNRVLKPKATTDSNGEAVFVDLSPGLYRVTASLPKRENAKENPYNYWMSSQGVTVADHVAVTSGGSNSISMFVDDTDETSVLFKVRHTDGTWLSKTGVATSWFKTASEHGRNSGSDLDKDGLGTISPKETGMWSLSIRYLTPFLGAKVVPIRSQPSYAGRRQVAISRLTPRQKPVLFAAGKVEPATIVATVADKDGKPIAGAVTLDVDPYGRSYHGQETRFASTDSQGNVAFDRVQANTHQHRIHATVPGVSTKAAKLDAPDTDFENEFAVPAKVVDVTAGDNKTVKLRVRPVAYIRGKIIPAPAKDRLLALKDRSTLKTLCLHSRESGEFIIGPVLPGKNAVWISEYKNNQKVASTKYVFDVKQAGVHREDLHYEPQATRTGSQNAVAEFSGLVLRADGKTPVYAARLAVYSPNTDVRSAVAWSDAQGKFNLHPKLNQLNYTGEVDNPGSPKRPVIVARLPGELGATVFPVPAGKTGKDLSIPENASDIKLVLPEPASVSGVVTVNGKSPLGLPASVTIFARYRGLGKLDSVLSVIGTANADGSYELKGLTPGAYEVQAAIDGIWLSRPQSLEVPEGKVWTKKVDFDVPPIGDVAQYLLEQKNGQPLIERKVRLLAPEFSGPLAEALRTPEMYTDASGLLYLEGMAAGEHKLLVDGYDSEVTITVPARGSPMETAKQLRIED